MKGVIKASCMIVSLFTLIFLSLGVFGLIESCIRPPPSLPWPTHPPPEPLKPLENVQIILNCSIPETSGFSGIKAINRGFSKQQAIDAALGLFDMSGPCAKTYLFSTESYAITDGPYSFIFFTYSGSIIYRGLPVSLPDYIPSNLPTKDEARKIAENFLEKVKNSELMPRNPALKVEFNDMGGAETIADRNGTIIYRIIHYWAVNFRAAFNGIKMMGPGADITLSIGDNGEIVGFEGRWEEVEAEPANLITPQQVLERLGYGRVVENPKSTVIIQSISPAYWVDNEDHIVPVYKIALIYSSLDGETTFYKEMFVSAIDYSVVASTK